MYKCCGHLESKLHNIYNEKRINHPVYHDGETEWFTLDEFDLIFIDELMIKFQI
jgi:hypothetical protein